MRKQMPNAKTLQFLPLDYCEKLWNNQLQDLDDLKVLLQTVFAKTLKGSDTMRKQMPNAKTLQQQLAETLAENERLKNEASRKKSLHFKVSLKGGISVYGLQRFPVTLYREQWERLFHPVEANKLLDFIKEHSDELKVKGE